MVERRRSAKRAEETIPFNDAIREGKDIIKQADKGWYRLGELAAKVQKAYGEGTLARLAKAIGMAACTLGRYRDVFRKWENYAPGRELPYPVLRELAAHPDRVQIVTN